jgi:hypothetical protein
MRHRSTCTRFSQKCQPPFELEVIFCVRGVITAPCGVPIFVSDQVPSSDTPAFSHFWINRSILGSATRCWRNFSSHSWSRLSKDTTTHYPSSALSRTRDYHASSSPIRRSVSGGPSPGAYARRLAVRAHSAGRQQVAGTSRMDGLSEPHRLTAAFSTRGLA